MVRITPETQPAVFASYVQAINLTGLLDHTFHGIGYATLNIDRFADRAHGIAVQSDGKVVVVGGTNLNIGGGRTGVFLTARYNTDGSLDPSFGNGLGYVTTSFSGPGTADFATAIAIQSDGKLVVAGQTNRGLNGFPPVGSFAIVRYNPDGSPDATFGPAQNGTVTRNLSGNVDGATSVVIQPDGKILLGGFTNILAFALVGGQGKAALLRYNADGSEDDSFGPDGNGAFSVSISGNNKTDIANSVLLQPDRKIIAIGATNISGAGGTGSFLVMRLTQEGILDSTFGPDKTGIVQTHISSNTVGYADGAASGVLQPDGKIVAVGSTNTQGTGIPIGDVCLVRYTSNGTLDASFGQGGIVTTNISGNGYLDYANAAVLQLDAFIVVAGATNERGTAGAPGSILVLRYTPEGTLDPSFGPQGIGYVTTQISNPPLYDAGYGVTLAANGSILVAGQTNVGAGAGGAPAEGDFTTLRYINPFTPATFTSSYGGVGFL